MRLRRLLGVCLLALITATAAAEYDVMVAIPGGSMRKRSSAGAEDEHETEIRLLPFLLDKGPVTNAAFRQFVRDQKYKTEAEKFGWSFVFRDFVSDDVKSKVTHTIPSAPWWLPVQRAFWRQPAGSGSSIGARLDFPVVQVSWNDARAFCRWKRKTLPTEDQWEWAARGGLARASFPWGKSFRANRSNLWQVSETSARARRGAIPTLTSNGACARRARFRTATRRRTDITAWLPSTPSRLRTRLLDMLGNTWEWTSSPFPAPPGSRQQMFVLRGASWIDTADGSANHRAEVGAKMGNTPDSASDNLSFRCASDGHERNAHADL
ncbi:inactive C-alpha-formylglycine-generating enzyme 2 isoform X2 [Hippocampus comes]|uniref:inactive C-alpha-formylglycine-generating enzyme 2 isoform X2 n=1 Tax=Hippocampus comes TaxID=109280 RepID=UPI00094E14EF|nr:PREDICTED: sulfatase-modifying factor 2 isoform X2 [Hippocampus comes]